MPDTRFFMISCGCGQTVRIEYEPVGQPVPCQCGAVFQSTGSGVLQASPAQPQSNGIRWVVNNRQVWPEKRPRKDKLP